MVRLYITPAPNQLFASLRELCRASSLIIQGTVEQTLPARETSSGALETDSVISVSLTLKGPGGIQKILLSQRGGSAGDLTISPAGYHVVQPNERYLLFLTEDRRPNVPDRLGMKRYLVTGIWSGLFLLDSGRMRLAADETDFLRRKYAGMTVEQIMAAVKEALEP